MFLFIEIGVVVRLVLNVGLFTFIFAVGLALTFWCFKLVSCFMVVWVMLVLTMPVYYLSSEVTFLFPFTFVHYRLLYFKSLAVFLKQAISHFYFYR
jgi:hypothetical protein